MSKSLSKRERMKANLLKRTKQAVERKKSSGKGYFKTPLPEGLNFFNPELGDHFIDVIPYEVGNNDPHLDKGDDGVFLEVQTHRLEEAGKTIICLKRMYNKRCPVCEHQTELKLNGADDTIIKALYPKSREIYNVFIKDGGTQEKKGVQIFEVSYHYMGKLLEPHVKGPVRPGQKKQDNYINYSSPDEDGRSIVFTVGSKTVKNQTYPEYTGHRLETRDYIIEDEVLDAAYSLDELIQIPTYEEVHQLYWGEDLEEESKEPEKELKEEEPEEPEEEVTRKIKAKPKKAEPEEEPEEEPEKEPDIYEMDKKELVKYMKECKFKIRGYSKMDEDDLRTEIEELIDAED